MNQTELLRMAAMHGEGRGEPLGQAKGWREAARVIREKRAAEDLAEHLDKSAKEKLPEHALTHVEANEMYNSDFVGTQMRCPTGGTLLHYVVLRAIHRRLQTRTAQRYIDVLLERHADCARADVYARTAADLDEERRFPVLHDLGAAAEARERARRGARRGRRDRVCRHARAATAEEQEGVGGARARGQPRDQGAQVPAARPEGGEDVDRDPDEALHQGRRGLSAPLRPWRARS